MSYGHSVQTPPAVEPVTLREAKKQVNQADVFVRDDVFLHGQVIPQVRQEFEQYTSLACITQTRVLTLDLRVCTIAIPGNPVQQVDLVQYLDKEYTWQDVDVDSYQVHTDRMPAIIEPVRDGSASMQWWPETANQRAKIKVTYTCGYGDTPEDVPENVKGCLLRMIESRYRFRGQGELPQELYWAMDELRVADEFQQYGIGDGSGITP